MLGRNPVQMLRHQPGARCARWHAGFQSLPLVPMQASLFGSSAPLKGPLEGHSLWDLASTTPGLARSYLFH